MKHRRSVGSQQALRTACRSEDAMHDTLIRSELVVDGGVPFHADVAITDAFR
jgi:hypothetical protein